MDITRKDVRKEVEELRQRLEEAETVLRYMDRTDGGMDDVIPPQADRRSDTLSADGDINLEELNIRPKVSKKATLIGDIRNVIDRIGSQEFTNNHIHAALNQLGKGSDAKHFKNRVSINVRKLVDDGVLVRTFKGSGSEPHKYKRAITATLTAKPTNISASTKLFGNKQE